MGDYVYRKFPDFTDAIQAFKPKDAIIREVCADYEEICTWLAVQDNRSAAPDPEAYADAQELKRNLESEILKLLEEHNDLVN